MKNWHAMVFFLLFGMWCVLEAIPKPVLAQQPAAPFAPGAPPVNIYVDPSPGVPINVYVHGAQGDVHIWIAQQQVQAVPAKAKSEEDKKLDAIRKTLPKSTEKGQ